MLWNNTHAVKTVRFTSRYKATRQMIPELEVLDQLLGGDLPVNVIAGLFSESSRCRKAIGAMLHQGEILLLDPEGSPLPIWRYRELQSNDDFWSEGTLYRLSITEIGAKRIR